MGCVLRICMCVLMHATRLVLMDTAAAQTTKDYTTAKTELLIRYISHTEGPLRNALLAPNQVSNSSQPKDVIPYIAYEGEEEDDFDPMLALSWIWERQVHDALFTYVAPVLLAVGTCGNLVCLVVLQSRAFRGTTQALMLTALALVDLGVLHTGLLRHVLKVSLQYDVRLQSSPACKIHYFLTYYFPHLSSWTIVLVTLERLMSLCHPFKVKVICTRQRVVGAWVIMALIMFGINSHWLANTDIRPEYYFADANGTQVLSFPRCAHPPNSKYFYENVWTWMDLAILCFIPIFIILPSNIVIMIKVCDSKNFRKSSMSKKGTSGQGPTNVSSVNSMLLVVSSFFVLTTTPLVIYYVGMNTWPQATLKEIAQTSMAYSICNTLYYLNSSINFFLYCLSGTQFRVALSVTVGCRPSTAALFRARSCSFNATMATAITLTRGVHGNHHQTSYLLPKRSQSQTSLHGRHSTLAVLGDAVRKAPSESCII